MTATCRLHRAAHASRPAAAGRTLAHDERAQKANNDQPRAAFKIPTNTSAVMARAGQPVLQLQSDGQLRSLRTLLEQVCQQEAQGAPCASEADRRVRVPLR